MKKFNTRLPLPKKTEHIHQDKTQYNRVRLDPDILEDARDILREQNAGPRNNEESDVPDLGLSTDLGEEL